MQREFLQPKAPFHPCILYKDKGQTQWKKLEEMPESEQRIILMRLEDDFTGRRQVADARKKGAKTPLQILNTVVPRVWGKLTNEFDIDGSNLNFEN